MQALQFLDVISMKDPSQKAQFFRTTLTEVIPFIPRVNFKVPFGKCKTESLFLKIGGAFSFNFILTFFYCDFLTQLFKSNLWSGILIYDMRLFKKQDNVTTNTFMKFLHFYMTLEIMVPTHVANPWAGNQESGGFGSRFGASSLSSQRMQSRGICGHCQTCFEVSLHDDCVNFMLM